MTEDVCCRADGPRAPGDMNYIYTYRNDGCVGRAIGEAINMFVVE